MCFNSQANEASNLVDRHLFHCDAINAVSTPASIRSHVHFWDNLQYINLLQSTLLHPEAMNACHEFNKVAIQGNEWMQDEFDIRADYMRWLQGLFSFCSYSFM